MVNDKIVKVKDLLTNIFHLDDIYVRMFINFLLKYDVYQEYIELLDSKWIKEMYANRKIAIAPTDIFGSSASHKAFASSGIDWARILLLWYRYLKTSKR